MGKTFAERLVQARRRRGLSQAELARLVNLKPSSIGNFEQGLSKSARKLTEIAHALRVRPEWLANGTPPIDPSPEISASTLDLARKIEQLSPPQLSAVRAMVDAFTSVELEKPKIRSTV